MDDSDDYDEWPPGFAGPQEQKLPNGTPHYSVAVKNSRFKRSHRDAASPSNHRHSRDEPESGHLHASSNHDETLDPFDHFVNAIKSNNQGLCLATTIVPEFDPMFENQTIICWIKKVEECAEFYNWDEREIIHYALPKLTGLAKSWYQSLPSICFTWDEWKSKLISSFPCKQNYAELLMQMLELRVKRGESLQQYYYSKLDLLQKCEITGKNAVDCLIHGIDDYEIKLGAIAAQCTSPEQVLKHFQSVERHLNT